MAGCHSVDGSYQQGYDFSNLDKLAVIEVQGQLKGPGARNQIADFFTMELMKKGYSAIERNQVQAILKEQEFQQSDVTTNEQAAEAGKILNVPAVLMVNVPRFGQKIHMTAKLIDVEDSSVLWISTGEGDTQKTLATILGAVAGAVVGVVSTGEDDQVIGGVAGGAIGGAAGYLLTPDEAKKAKEIIKAMFKDMPSRVKTI